MPVKKKEEEFVELTYLLKHLYPPDEPPLYSLRMASSEVDQRFLGHFAKMAGNGNASLSQSLYRVLGLSVMLAEKLLRSRKNRRADPSRDASTRQLLHHILWLSREGQVMVEQYILPMVDSYIELKVLSYKLRASFYHIFVLFQNDPSVNDLGSKSTPKTTGPLSLFPDPLSPSARTPRSSLSPTSRQRTPDEGYTTGGAPATPQGLLIPYATTPKTPSATVTFLLPCLNYVPFASTSFATANTLAESLLPGSHPLRLSVKLDYVVYIYDCLHEGEQSRNLAKKSIADVYSATEGMDNESFEDAAELVGMLRKMTRRGLKGSRGDERPEKIAAINNLGSVRILDKEMQDVERSSSGSEFSLPIYTLTQLYQGIFDDLDQCLQKVANLSLDPKLEKDYRDAKNSLGDFRSSLICWGCDIRIETDSLKDIEGTIFDLTLRSCFGHIKDRFQQLLSSGTFANAADLDDLKTAILSLKEFIGPIRTSQALKSGRGPLDGMARKLDELADLSRKGAT